MESKSTKHRNVCVLADAALLVMDDLGAEGVCVSGYAKAKLRMSLEPFLSTEPDEQPDYTLETAKRIMEQCK